MQGFLIFLGIGVIMFFGLSWFATWVSKRTSSKNCEAGGDHDWGNSAQRIGKMTWRKCQKCGHEQTWHDGPVL